MELQKLRFGSPEYEAALALRYRVLRKPLGVEWTEEERAWEPKERHFGLMKGAEVVACVSVRPMDERRFKLRQMAVDPEHQGAGVGRELLERVEAVLCDDGTREIVLNAREVAVGFYEKQGYERVGEQFVEVGIPHWKMWKGLGIGD